MKHSIFRALFALLALLPPLLASAYDFMVDGIAYNKLTSSTVEVTYTNYRSSDNYYSLTTASIPSNVSFEGITYAVTSIGSSAFYNCSGLTSVTIPSSVTSIGSNAFLNCSHVGEVTCQAETPPSWDNITMFSNNVYNHSPLYVPIGSKRLYMEDQSWGQFANIIGIEEEHEVLAIDILLNHSQISLMQSGNAQLIATVLPDSATNKVVSWTSNNPAVASVDNTGQITAHAVGMATITATTTDGSNMSASCVVIVTEDVNNYGNYLSINDITAYNGSTIVVPVKMTNDASIISFQTDIWLPEGIELLQEDGEYLIEPSNRFTGSHSITSNDVSNGHIRIICYSSNFRPFTGQSGDDLFYITLTFADDASGDYIVQLRNTLLTNVDFVDLDAPDVNANVNVKPCLMGDADNNGMVNVTDVVTTARYLLDLNPQPFVFKTADMNRDNRITVTDVTLIARKILYPDTYAPMRMPALDWTSDRMSGKDITLGIGETSTVAIDLDNATDYTAFQLDLQLPEGLAADNFRLTSRGGNTHALEANTLADGKTRVLCYSSTLEAIAGNSGAVLTFDVTLSGNVSGGILVDGIEAVTTACQTVMLDGFAIGVNNTTSVDEWSVANGMHIYAEGMNVIIESPTAQTVTISDIAGRSKRVNVIAGRNMVPVNHAGVYLVSDGKNVAKLILK